MSCSSASFHCLSAALEDFGASPGLRVSRLKPEFPRPQRERHGLVHHARGRKRGRRDRRRVGPNHRTDSDRLVSKLGYAERGRNAAVRRYSKKQFRTDTDGERRISPTPVSKSDVSRSIRLRDRESGARNDPRTRCEHAQLSEPARRCERISPGMDAAR